MNLDKSLILNKLKNHYAFKKDSDFARFLGIKPQTLASWYSRGTFDVYILYAKCVEISPDYLLSGEGEILREKALQSNFTNEPNSSYLNSKDSDLIKSKDKIIELLELENIRLKGEMIQLQGQDKSRTA